MVTVCKDCYPHCDFCIHAEYYYLSLNGERVKAGVEKCRLHPDEHHQSLARSLCYCKDFHCFKAKEDSNGT